MNKIFCFAIPNGGRRDVREGGRLKREGVLAGASDIIIINNKVYFIEVKTEKGRQTETQKAFQSQVIGLGHEYKIWRSLSDAMRFFGC